MTVSEIYDCSAPGSCDDPQTLHDLVSLVSSAIAEWPGGQTGLSIMSVGPCGCYCSAHIENYDLYEAGLSEESGFPGAFGYSAHTVRAMQEQGFYRGPAVGLVFKNTGPVWKPDSDEQNLQLHISKPFQNEVERLGIRCFLASGGDFPGETNHSAIVLDISDPDFLKKIKPAFLGIFSSDAAKQVHLRVQDWIDTQQEARAYIYGMLCALAEAIQAEWPEAKILESSGLINVRYKPSAEMLQKVQRYIDYEMNFIRPPLRAIRSVLSIEEKQELFIDTAVQMAECSKPENPCPPVYAIS